MNVHASNLIRALHLAIKTQEDAERGAGYTMRSALLQGWGDLLHALERGQAVRIIGTAL